MKKKPIDAAKAFQEKFAPLPLSREQKQKIREEIITHCDLAGDCWIYRTKNNSGYGVKKIAGKTMAVSRFMLCLHSSESFNIPFDACHVPECPYPACCNPRHLFWETSAVNAIQREEKRRERNKTEIVLPPIPLGHRTHEQHAMCYV